MSDMRVRQIALVAENLDPVVEQLGAVFGLKVGFRDPGVGFYGLVNVVMPVGGEFLEVVQPIKGRRLGRPLLEAPRRRCRLHGHPAGEDALAHRKRLADIGVRMIAESHHDGYIFTHFHPADCAGVLSSIDTVEDDKAWKEPLSKWPPAGKDWKDFPADQALGIRAVDIQHPNPKAAAERWHELFEATRPSSRVDPGTRQWRSAWVVRLEPAPRTASLPALGGSLGVRVLDVDRANAQTPGRPGNPSSPCRPAATC